MQHSWMMGDKNPMRNPVIAKKNALARENEKSWSWKGEAASYKSKHEWIAKKLGTPSKCSICKTQKSSRFEWANKSGEYRRDFSDWIRLCINCHRLFDNKNRGVTWFVKSKKWRARIKVRGKEIHLGLFKLKKEAIEARNTFYRKELKNAYEI